MKKVIFSIIIAIFIYSSAAKADGLVSDKGKVLAERCKSKKRNYEIVECINDGGFSLLHAYMSLYINPKYGGKNPDRAWDDLRLEALSNASQNEGFNKTKLSALKILLSDKEELIKLYEKAIDWADKEISQNSGQLYERAYTIVEDLSDKKSKKSFQKLFLYLAAKKGHKQADIDAQKMSDEFLKKIEEKY